LSNDQAKRQDRREPARPKRRSAGLPAPMSEAQELKRRERIYLIIFCMAAVLIPGYLNLLTPNITASDALYHMRHASLYASISPFMSEFPWLTGSVIGEYASDIWYGFHILLIPFTYFHEALTQLKSAGIFILTVMLVLFYFAMRKCRIVFPHFWPFVLLFMIVWRLAQTRPNALSLGIIAVLFSYLLTGSIWGVFFSSLALTFFHLAFFWLAMVVALAVFMVKLFTEKVVEWRKLIALFGGLIGGLLLRPNPIGGAKLVYVQVIELMLVKQKVMLTFGRELSKLPLKELYDTYAPSVLLWLGVMALFLVVIYRSKDRLQPEARTLLWSSFGLSLLFFGMTVFMSARALDQWAPFAVIFMAGCFTHIINPQIAKPKELLRWNIRMNAGIGGAILLVAMVVVSMSSYMHKMDEGVRPYAFRDAAEWLKNNAKPKEIVFHTSWGDFSKLFYWNPQNYYIGGMDPIFEYAYSTDLYWKATHLLLSEGSSYTWGTQYQKDSVPEDTFTVLRRDFKASYLWVNLQKEPLLYQYASKDPRFIPCYDDGEIAIFKLSNSTAK